MAPIQSIIVTPQEMLISRSKAAVNVEEAKKQATALNLPAFGQMLEFHLVHFLLILLKHFLPSIPS